jgi:cytochrome P450
LFPLTETTRDFDDESGVLVLGVAPSFLAPKGLAGRIKVQEALKRFYTERQYLEPDVSPLIRTRAVIQEEAGLELDIMSVAEYSMAWVATSNTVPSLLWFSLHIFSRPDFVERAREEILEATTITHEADGSRTACINTVKLEKKPFLTACFQETQRLYNSAIGNRRVMQDSILTDADGRDYLLKKGITIQWAAGIPQQNEDIWGADLQDFNPDRWLKASAQESKRQRGAMFSFGGGTHLCPGRSFALAENMGIFSGLALGFDEEAGMGFDGH